MVSFDNVVMINLVVLVLYNFEFFIFLIVDEKGDIIYVYLLSMLEKVCESGILNVVYRLYFYEVM